MSLKATLVFLVAMDAFGQAPQSHAAGANPKGQGTCDSVCRKRFWSSCRQSRAALPAHSRRCGGTA